MEKKIDPTRGRVERAYEAIAGSIKTPPSLGIILGSGLGGFSRRLEGATYFPYQKIPYFFQPLTPGHEGILSFGRLGGRTVAVLEGRIHHYEGYFMREVVFPVRILHRLGVRGLVLCNAAGSLTSRLPVGSIMIVADHINLMGTNPLIGQIHQGLENPFLPMGDAYDPELRGLAKRTAAAMDAELAEGVLAAVSGPCFETAAESRMLCVLGADAVTMSTIPEVIMARFLKMKVLAMSLITNCHCLGPPTEHMDVLAVAHERLGFLMELIARIVDGLPATQLDEQGASKTEVYNHG